MLGSRRAYGPVRALDRARKRGIGMTFDLRVHEEVRKEVEKRREGGGRSKGEVDWKPGRKLHSLDLSREHPCRSVPCGGEGCYSEAGPVV